MRSFVSGLILAVFLVFAGGNDAAEARGGYASWLKHGDTYSVSGAFAGYKGSFRATVHWRGNRFVISTPLGTFPLKRAGGGVTFKVRFEKAWATVTWVYSRAYVVWKGQRGTAAVRRVGNQVANQTRGDKIR